MAERKKTGGGQVEGIVYDCCKYCRVIDTNDQNMYIYLLKNAAKYV